MEEERANSERLKRNRRLYFVPDLEWKKQRILTKQRSKASSAAKALCNEQNQSIDKTTDSAVQAKTMSFKSAKMRLPLNTQQHRRFQYTTRPDISNTFVDCYVYTLVSLLPDQGRRSHFFHHIAII